MSLRDYFLTALVGCFTTVGLMNAVHADTLDDCVAREMRVHAIPGVSLAIIQNGQIISTRAYGYIDLGGKSRITSDTLFQAASVSKVVTALGALMLVQQGKLSLDDDVNGRLKDWKVPDNEFTRVEKVTVRRILSHTAGFTVHGFFGYARDQSVPTLTDVLDGTGGTNTAPIRVASVPGSQWRYSGGGYTVLQKLMIDVTGQPFPTLMREMVLKPLQMERSTFEQPLLPSFEASAAAGQVKDKTLAGRWRVYPEMAAAGLWTTPSDLALLFIALQRAKGGQKDGVISPTIAQWMTTPVLNRDGLGLFMSGPHEEFFGHDGRNAGFDSLVRASATDGVVVMINANDDTGGLMRICRAAWTLASLQPPWPTPNRELDSTINPNVYADYVGRYSYGDRVQEITVENGHIFAQLTGQRKLELLPSGPDTFFFKAVDAGLAFNRDRTGVVSSVSHTQNGDTFSAPKIKP